MSDSDQVNCRLHQQQHLYKVPHMDAYSFLGISDWLINLSAGWFAAALIVPAVGRKPTKVNLWILTVNVIFAILFLIEAIQLKRITEVL